MDEPVLFKKYAKPWLYPGTSYTIDEQCKLEFGLHFIHPRMVRFVSIKLYIKSSIYQFKMHLVIFSVDKIVLQLLKINICL